MKWLFAAVMLVACACPRKPTHGGGAGSGSDVATGSATPAAGSCDGARARVELLYGGEAAAKEPKRVAEAVADNTAMVMADCAKDPAKVTACIASVTTVRELETRCLIQLDDEGTEGDALR